MSHRLPVDGTWVAWVAAADKNRKVKQQILIIVFIWFYRKRKVFPQFSTVIY